MNLQSNKETGTRKTKGTRAMGGLIVRGDSRSEVRPNLLGKRMALHQ